jgi:RNA polymerase-binding transcription factor DksA
MKAKFFSRRVRDTLDQVTQRLAGLRSDEPVSAPDQDSAPVVRVRETLTLSKKAKVGAAKAAPKVGAATVGAAKAAPKVGTAKVGAAKAAPKVGAAKAAPKVGAAKVGAAKAAPKVGTAKVGAAKVGIARAVREAAVPSDKDARVGKAPASQPTAKASRVSKVPAAKVAIANDPVQEKAMTASSKNSSAKRLTATSKSKSALPVKDGEEPWTKAEISGVRAELDREYKQLSDELTELEADITQLMTESVHEAGDDDADAGNKSFEREHEVALAGGIRDMRDQVGKAVARLDDGSYGICTSCEQSIGKLRLQAFPRAAECLACKQRAERR